MKKCSPKNEKRFEQLERELRDLDEEIANISSELENGSNKKNFINKQNFESNYSQKNLNRAYKTPQQPKYSHYSSSRYSYSPALQEKIEKTEIKLDEEENSSSLSDLFDAENEFTASKNAPLIQNYIPISERIKETIKKKQEFIRKEKEKEEREIKEKCSFTPTKFNTPELDNKLNWKPKSQHKIYQREKEKNEISPDTKKISKKSEKIIRNLERQDSFYTRQIESDRKKKTYQYNSPILKNQGKGPKTPQESDKILSGAELRELNARLMRPPNRTKAYLAEDEALNGNKKVTLVNKEHIEQLYENSLNCNKEAADNNQIEIESEFSTPKGKRVTPQKAKEIGEKMYMDSIKSMRETRKKANEMREFLEEGELRECTFRPVINKISPKVLSKNNQSPSAYSNVKGADDFYQRMYMAKLKREREQDSSFISENSGYESYSVSRSPIKYYSPTSSPPKKNKDEVDVDSYEVDSLLQEIDSSYIYDPNAL